MGLSPEGLCLNHDPARQEIARQTRIAGGRASGAKKREKRIVTPSDAPPPPKTLEDAVRYFAFITHAVATGTMDARTGHECAYALTGFKSAVEKRDLERQIIALRKELADHSKRPARVS